MSDQHKWIKYKRKGVAEMRPVTEEEINNFLDPIISMSAADVHAGCPREGDMIARNPNDHSDQWLVNREYFKENFYTE